MIIDASFIWEDVFIKSSFEIDFIKLKGAKKGES